MIDGVPVVVCIPAGRERVMRPLLYHLRSLGDQIDRIDLWENTTVEEDLEFIHNQVDDKVGVVAIDNDRPRTTVRNPGNERRYARDNSRFYRNYTDPEPVYIRIDDDVVWLHPEAIERLVRRRIAEDGPLLISGNVWNNAVFTHLHQQAGHLPDLIPPVEPFCMDQIGWARGDVAVELHETLLSHIEAGTVDGLVLEDRLIAHGQEPRRHVIQYSTNFNAIRGEDMVQIGPHIWNEEEEVWLMGHAEANKAWPLLAGDVLVAHYSFWRQRPALDETDILDRYTRIAETAYHNSYYRLMGFAE